MLMNQNVLAASIAAGGAVLVKVVEKWMERRAKEKSNEELYDEGERIRKELRQDVDRLQDENERLRTDSDKWRAKFWKTQNEESTRIKELESELERLYLVIDSLRSGEGFQGRDDSIPDRE